MSVVTHVTCDTFRYDPIRPKLVLYDQHEEQIARLIDLEKVRICSIHKKSLIKSPYDSREAFCDLCEMEWLNYVASEAGNLLY